MERITSWLWRPSPKDAPQEGSYWLDADKNELVIKKTAMGKTWEDARYGIADVLTMYAARGYDKLQRNSQAVYDFLLARGYQIPNFNQQEN